MNKNKGIFFIIFAALSFSLMNISVHLAGDLPTIQKSFFRNFIALIFAGIVLYKKRIWITDFKKNIWVLILRSFFGTLGILCNFYAVDHLDIADASMLNKMSPFFVILFSLFILNEKIDAVQVFSVIGAFLGSLFIIKPTMLHLNSASLIGLTGGLCAGIAYTLVRLLGNRGEKGPFIVFFFSLFSCVMLLPNLILNFHPMTKSELFFLFLSGVFALFGQYGITLAYINAPAREISIYDYSQIIFSAILGFFIFGQIPDSYSIIGYVAIIGMALVLYYHNNAKYKK